MLLWRDELLADHTLRKAGYRVEVSAFFGFAGGPTGEVGLVLAALGVGEVGAIVLVYCQAETAFEGADVVFEAIELVSFWDGLRKSGYDGKGERSQVGVFVKVNGLEREFSETLASILV